MVKCVRNPLDVMVCSVIHVMLFLIIHRLCYIRWELILCMLFILSVDCVYSDWSSFGVCSKTCGPGVKSKYRLEDI